VLRARLARLLEGRPIEESGALLDELWDHATREELTWQTRSQRGDLLLWDNRCTMQRTRNKVDARPAACAG
jgi:taurine dioxygenase